jgi:hypothetical protein
MPDAVGTLFNRHQDRIVEVINKNLDIIMPSLDPVWRDTIVTSQGVGPADAIGRDMRILKVFMGSMAGVLEQAFPRDDVVLYGDDTATYGAKLHSQTLTQTWPSPLDGPNASPYRLGIPMRAMMSNIMFTMGELTAEALPATIGELVAPKLEGFARNIAHTLCNYWYINQNKSYRLCLATSWSAWSSANGVYSATFKPDNQATDRFYVGQRIDFINVAETARINDTVAAGGGSPFQTVNTRIPVFVAAVDELVNKVTVASRTDPNSWITDFDPGIANVRVVYANSWIPDADAPFAATGVAGVNSWLKMGVTAGAGDQYLLGSDNLGAAVGRIDVDVHPEHKSFSQDLSGAPLTEHKMRQYLRRFHAAKNKYGYYIDCLIASDGVWLAYESTKIGREYIDRTGRLSSLMNEGTNNSEYGGFTFAFDGRTYNGYTSCYVESGTMYGIRKGGNNWKRYVPPPPRGVRNFDRTEPFIPFNFVAGILTGLGTNQLPIFDSSATGNLSRVTEGSQMPGMLRMQLVPDQPCGMKLHNIGEDRVYSSESNN